MSTHKAGAILTFSWYSFQSNASGVNNINMRLFLNRLGYSLQLKFTNINIFLHHILQENMYKWKMNVAHTTNF